MSERVSGSDPVPGEIRSFCRRDRSPGPQCGREERASGRSHGRSPWDRSCVQGGCSGRRITTIELDGDGLSHHGHRDRRGLRVASSSHSPEPKASTGSCRVLIGWFRGRARFMAAGVRPYRFPEIFADFILFPEGGPKAEDPASPVGRLLCVASEHRAGRRARQPSQSLAWLTCI